MLASAVLVSFVISPWEIGEMTVYSVWQCQSNVQNITVKFLSTCRLVCAPCTLFYPLNILCVRIPVNAYSISIMWCYLRHENFMGRFEYPVKYQVRKPILSQLSLTKYTVQIVILLVQDRLRTEVLCTPSPSTQPGFELMTFRSWQFTSCHWDTCCNHLAINDFIHTCDPLCCHVGK